MHAAPQALLIGDAQEQRGQLLALAGVEPLADGFLMRPGDAPDRLQHRTPRRGEVQGVGPPIVRIVAPLDEPAFFQLVDESDEAARQDVEMLRERLLAEPARGQERPEDPRMRG